MFFFPHPNPPQTNLVFVCQHNCLDLFGHWVLPPQWNKNYPTCWIDSGDPMFTRQLSINWIDPVQYVMQFTTILTFDPWLVMLRPLMSLVVPGFQCLEFGNMETCNTPRNAMKTQKRYAKVWLHGIKFGCRRFVRINCREERIASDRFVVCHRWRNRESCSTRGKFYRNSK